jgi:multidrug resistance efflux pump
VLSSSRVQLPTVEDVQKTLKQALARLEQSCSNEEKELREVKSSIATAESNTEALRKSLKTASEDVRSHLCVVSCVARACVSRVACVLF